MPTNDSFEYDYTPGYTKPTHEFGTPFGDEFHAEAVQELLLSMAGYTQRGVTLAGGQGVLPTGTILAQHSASGTYVAWQGQVTGSNSLNVPLGVLRDSRDTGGTGTTTLTGPAGTFTLTGSGTVVTPSASPAGKAATMCQGNLVYRGILNANLVSGTATGTIITGTGGGVIAATLTSLGARVVNYGNGVANQAFPGGPMDGMTQDGGTTVQGVNAWIF